MTDPDPQEEPQDIAQLARVSAARAQDRLAANLGVSRARRIETVVAMLNNNVRRAPGYWIQLTLATGIATLGLVLGSTAVIIGAMLVSPLMGPILELGMGFAVGSSLLVLRAALRVTLSVVVVISGAALLTLALPFHEVTGEIASRAAPTALDLLVAVFCALTAAYTTVRPGSDTTAAAAGTAIGIALVPPLCATGFGIGTASAKVASGAALLFTANFSAILVFAVLSFLVLGYDQVDAATLEHDFLERDSTRTGRLAERAHGVLRAGFGSRYGLAMRLLIPLVFLGSVYVPLGRALDEVSWEVRVRAGIRRILVDESGRTVQTSLALERHTVSLRLLVVGSPAEAAALQKRLETRIAAAAGVTPTVVVIAVPDMAALGTVAAEESRAEVPPDIGSLSSTVAVAMAGLWPTAAAGPLAGWRIELGPGGEAIVATHHLGLPLGRAGEQLLARALSAQLGRPVRVADVSLPSERLVAEQGGEGPWLVTALGVLDGVGRLQGYAACVEGRTRPNGRTAIIDRHVLTALEATPLARAGRLTVTMGTRWSVRVARTTCDSTTAPKPDSARARAEPIVPSQRSTPD